MKKSFPYVLTLILVCLGCGGSGAVIDTRPGLIFARYVSFSNPTIETVSNDGGEVTTITGLIGRYPSMDQARTVYSMSNEGNIIKTVGGVNTGLTNSGQDSAPCVSPDGSKIVFNSTRDGYAAVYAMMSDGTNLTKIAGTSTFNIGKPAISKDGTKVVFTMADNTTTSSFNQLYTVNFDGTGLTQLTNDEIGYGSPAFDPTGKYIVFSAVRSGTLQICSLDIATKEISELTTGPLFKFNPTFDVKGKGIYYFTQTQGNFVNTDIRQIWRCDPDGSNPVQLTSGPYHSDKWSTWVY